MAVGLEEHYVPAKEHHTGLEGADCIVVEGAGHIAVAGLEEDTAVAVVDIHLVHHIVAVLGEGIVAAVDIHHRILCHRPVSF